MVEADNGFLDDNEPLDCSLGGAPLSPFLRFVLRHGAVSRREKAREAREKDREVRASGKYFFVPVGALGGYIVGSEETPQPGEGRLVDADTTEPKIVTVNGDDYTATRTQMGGVILHSVDNPNTSPVYPHHTGSIVTGAPAEYLATFRGVTPGSI